MSNVMIFLEGDESLHIELIDEGLIEVKVVDKFGDVRKLVEIKQGDNYEGNFDDESISEIQEWG